MKVFLFGSKTITSLPESFTRQIDRYCEQGCEFLIGDCFGADRLMQQYLHFRGYSFVTVYVSGENVRHNIGDYPVKYIAVPDSVSGFTFYRQKDIAMIHDCDAALAIWDGKTRGTRCNIEDLEKIGKHTAVEISL